MGDGSGPGGHERLCSLSRLEYATTMDSGELKQEGYDFMTAAFEVYNVLGSGMAEEVYQESLEIELGLRAIEFSSKPEVAGD